MVRAPLEPRKEEEMGCPRSHPRVRNGVRLHCPSEIASYDASHPFSDGLIYDIDLAHRALPTIATS